MVVDCCAFKFDGHIQRPLRRYETLDTATRCNFIIVGQYYFLRSDRCTPDSFFREKDAETLVLTSSARVFVLLKEVVTIIYCGGRISSLIHWHGLVWEPLGVLIDSDNAACPLSSIGPGLRIAGFQKWQDFPWQVAGAVSGDHCLAWTHGQPPPVPPRPIRS